MTKKELLEILEQVKDDAIIYVGTEYGLFHVRLVTDIVVGDDVQNEITLDCY